MAAAAAPPPAGVGGGDHDLAIQEVDALLASFSGDPAGAAVFAPLPAQAPEAGASRGLVAPGDSLIREGLGEVERFLMEDSADEAAVDGADEFLDGLLVGDGEDDVGPNSGGGRSPDGAIVGEDHEVLGVGGDDDPNSKKKRRQMRNRDSAMRKKMYVKDLEMKSKYLEAECCRLSFALQCCAAENMALRQCLLKDRPIGAPIAMQESAVLTETLPLVSLLWLVSIICLFLMPNRSLVPPNNLKRELRKLATASAKNSVKMTIMAKNGDDPGTLGLIHLGRRCRGTRARIKSP